MNGLLNKTVLRRNVLNIKSTSIYSIVLKNKFRRLTQPGLTRYSYDEYDHQNGTMEFSRVSHKSNAEELIATIPTIEVEDTVAICYGVNQYGWGHPTEYITLNTRNIDTPSVCKYCGLKYVKKASHH